MFKKEQIPWNKGKHHTEEEKKKLSEIMKGKNTWMKGRKLSEETKKKMSDSQRDVYHYKEWNEKISKAHKGIKFSKKHRENISKSRKGLHPSEETKRKMAEKMKGERNPNWKGGITPLHKSRINDIRWHEIRKLVYMRDNWICQICGIHCRDKIGKNKIQCHHIVPWVISKNDNMQNLVTLCRSCKN